MCILNVDRVNSKVNTSDYCLVLHCCMVLIFSSATLKQSVFLSDFVMTVKLYKIHFLSLSSVSLYLEINL